MQIAEYAANVQPGAAEVALTVENRHDFRALAGMRLQWALQRNGGDVATGSVPLSAGARARETVRIPLTIPADTGTDVLSLKLRCLDEGGNEIVDRVVRLDVEGTNRRSWLDQLPTVGKPTVSDDAGEVRVALPDWTMTVARATGDLTIRDRAGQVIVAGIVPHTGRKPTMAEALSTKDTGLWAMSTLRKLEAPEVKVERTDGKVKLAVTGRYPRPDAPEQAMVGGYELELADSGAMTVRYNFTPEHAKGMLSEVGLSILVPKGFDEFRWLGQGPYAGYPGKDKLNEFGLFQLHRDDLRFQGNRRGTELALLTTATGNGFLLSTPAADVAVERDGDGIVLSHNALIGGLGNKGTRPETTLKLDAVQHVAGKFTLLLVQPAWPDPLARWFGHPARASDVFRPFYHSYDQ